MSSARAPSTLRSRTNRDSDWDHPLPPLPQHFSGMSGVSGFSNTPTQNVYPGMKRHQLYDPPVIRDEDSLSMASRPSQMGSPRKQTIKFGEQDMVHSYHMPGSGDNTATHQPRSAFRIGQFPTTPYTPVCHTIRLPETLLTILTLAFVARGYSSSVAHPSSIDPRRRIRPSFCPTRSRQR